MVLGWGIKGRGGVVANSIVVNDASGSLSLEAGPFLDDEDGGGSGFSESETDPFRLDASSSSERGGDAIKGLKRADEDMALAATRRARMTILEEEERRGGREGGEGGDSNGDGNCGNGGN